MSLHISNRDLQRGFTLVEMAMSLSLIGLAVAALMVAFKIYTASAAIETTRNNTQIVARAIENFILENGRFPCPAAIDLAIENPRYGQEANCVALSGYQADGSTGSAVTPGGFSGGIWLEEGARSTAQHVVRGMVPFQALNIPEHYVNDGYGNRLFYAVTAAQTTPESFLREGGQIAVMDQLAESGNTHVESNHFIVFSAGANREGAYNRYGKAVLPCGRGLDGENCNTSPTSKAAVYRATQQSESRDPAHKYDDYMVNSTTLQIPLWRLDDSNLLNMRTIDLNNRVMMGALTPATSPLDIKVDVGGAVRSMANTHGEEFCLNADGSKCFKTELIAAEMPAMNCTDGSYARASMGSFMTGIARSEVRCADALSFACPSGQYMTGMQNDGTPRCAPYAFTPPPPPALP